MRVLVATNELQGHRRDDYAHTVEGELVVAEVAECANPGCGCDRGFPGLASSQATTTAIVVDLPHITPDDLYTVVADWLDRSGWSDLFRSADQADNHFTSEFDDVEEMIDAIVDEHLETIATVCDSFAVGTIVERSGTMIRARAIPFAA